MHPTAAVAAAPRVCRLAFARSLAPSFLPTRRELHWLLTNTPPSIAGESSAQPATSRRMRSYGWGVRKGSSRGGRRMFFLALIKESVKIEPRRLRGDFIDTIRAVLDTKYCNKVVIDLGLCISVFDVLEAEDPYVHQGETTAVVRVKFRLILFRPFVGEVLEGRVRSSSEEGIHVTLGFFDDILVPAHCMPADTHFDPTEQVWAWHYEGSRMFLDAGERIRIRMLSEHFTESAPLQKEALMAVRGTAMLLGEPSTMATTTTTATVAEVAPYRLTASIAEDGLGLVRWWLPADGGEDDKVAAAEAGSA